MAQLDNLATEIYVIAKEKGFNEHAGDTLYIPTKLALIHSEVSEALEADRVGDRENLQEEIADILIRTLHLARYLAMDIGEVVLRKIEYNRTRPIMHGNKRY